MLPALIPVLTSGLGTLIDRLIPDEAGRERAKLEMEAKLLEAANAANIAQMEVNKTEAGHTSIFVAGWRPFIGWCCGLALGFQFVGFPLASWIAASVGKPLPPAPTLDGMLWELIFGMLGIAGMRTFEKSRGLAK